MPSPGRRGEPPQAPSQGWISFRSTRAGHHTGTRITATRLGTARTRLGSAQPRAHRTPQHLPRSRLPSRPDRADSDTLDIRFIQLREPECLSYFWKPARVLRLSSANSSSSTRDPPAAFWICLLQIALQIFQPLVPVPASRPYPTLSLRHCTGLYRYAPACSSALSSRLASLFGL